MFIQQQFEQVIYRVNLIVNVNYFNNHAESEVLHKNTGRLQFMQITVRERNATSALLFLPRSHGAFNRAIKLSKRNDKFTQESHPGY